MNLEYRILWFENESDWFDSIIDNVKEIVEDTFGFSLVEPTREIDDSNFGNLKFENYDLVLMDYSLDNEPNGDTIIQRLRSSEIYTDVVFYSSRGEAFVREKMKENGIDGVYCVSRDSHLFIPKVQKIIQTTIKKVQDINNMRGLVMAEVAELDNKMIDILKLHYSNLDQRQKEVFISDRKAKVLLSLSDMSAKITDIREDAFLEHRDFNSYHKWRSVMSIVKDMDDTIKSEIKLYNSEILEKRNKLAHVKEIRDENGIVTLANGDFFFDDAACKSLRVYLKKHRKNLDTIKNTLSD